MVIINHYLWGNQIQHRKTGIPVRKKCLLWAKMFSNSFVVVILPFNSQTHRYQGGENLKQMIIHEGWLNTSFGDKNLCDDDIQQAEVSYRIWAWESFWNWHFSKYLPVRSNSGSGSNNTPCTGQLSLQNSTFKSCVSSFLCFEPSYCQMLSHSLALILPVLP